MITDLIKICGTAVLCVAVILIMKELKASFSWGVKIGGMLLIFGMLIFSVSEIKESLVGLFGGELISEYAGLMLKGFGIAFLVKICSDICRESGEGGIAFGIESAGKLCILYMCIPIIKKILTYIKEIFELGEV